MAAKKKNKGFQFDFSALKFAQDAEEQEIPKLRTEPAAFENAEEMADRIDIKKDYFAFVSGGFIFGDFIEALCFKKRLAPSEIYITTLGMSGDNIDSIVNLVDYLGAKKVNLIISHYFQNVERHNLIPYMEREFAGRNINVSVLQSHCKMVLIFSEQANIMISGSANLSSSNNVEQFIITHDESAIAYAKEKLDNIIDRFTVYNGIDGKKEVKKGNTGKKCFNAMIGG